MSDGTKGNVDVNEILYRPTRQEHYGAGVIEEEIDVTDVIVVIGAGQIGQAIARRVGALLLGPDGGSSPAATSSWTAE